MCGSDRSRALLATAVLLGAVISLGAWTGRARAAVDCTPCHDEIAEPFPDTQHGRAFRFGEGAKGNCSSCHGPGVQHAESDGEDMSDIVIPDKAPAERVNTMCQSCHGNGPEHGYWEGSHHEKAGLDCADCHSVHGAWPEHRGAQISSEVELCVSCHGPQRKALNQRSHHPMAEGKMQCSSCHMPHGSGTPKDLKADALNDLCYSCHEEKRGPFLWEHSPVRENCATCHTPHGSNHHALLVTRTSQLCQSCHMQGRHQTVAGTETSMWNVNRQCANCHSLVHGSNHPSGPLFQR
jgi:DmsE family decaheme c-type cytochrome